jgi:hypothetical protein
MAWFDTAGVQEYIFTLKGQCHEIMSEMSQWSSSLGLNYCFMSSSWPRSRDTVPFRKEYLDSLIRNPKDILRFNRSTGLNLYLKEGVLGLIDE